MTNKYIRLLSAFSLSIFIFLFVAHSIFAASPIVVEFTPSSLSSSVGNTLPFSINFASPDPSLGISGFDMCLKYDPSIIVLEQLSEPIDTPSSSSEKFQSLKKEIDNDSGQACFFYVSVLPDGELSRSIKIDGVLSGKNAGTTTVSFSKSQVVGNIEGNSYQVNPTGLSVNITSSVTNTVPATTAVKDPGFFQRLFEFLKKIIPFI